MKLNSASHWMGTVVPKFYLVKMRYAPVSEWVPNLRNRGNGREKSGAVRL